MRSIGPSSEDEMVLAFLRAEIDSAEYGPVIEGALSKQGLTRSIVDSADLKNPSENRARALCLSCSRGYRLNERLFLGFPNGVAWQRVLLSPEELGQTKYINQSVWVIGSGGTRFVSDGAKNLDAGTLLNSLRTKIRAIEASVRAGCRPPELILVGKGDDSALVIVEGHSRATAYLRAVTQLTDGVGVIVGTASDMDNWNWY